MGFTNYCLKTSGKYWLITNALPVEQIARRGKIKEVYMFLLSIGFTRYLMIYISQPGYISVTVILRVHPLFIDIYAGYTRYLVLVPDTVCSTGRAFKMANARPVEQIMGQNQANALLVEQIKAVCSTG
jgi:hypothetical protein